MRLSHRKRGSRQCRVHDLVPPPYSKMAIHAARGIIIHPLGSIRADKLWPMASSADISRRQT